MIRKAVPRAVPMRTAKMITYEDGEDDQESCAEGGAYEDDKDGEDPYESGEAH